MSQDRFVRKIALLKRKTIREIWIKKLHNPKGLQVIVRQARPVQKPVGFDEFSSRAKAEKAFNSNVATHVADGWEVISAWTAWMNANVSLIDSIIREFISQGEKKKR